MYCVNVTANKIDMPGHGEKLAWHEHKIKKKNREWGMMRSNTVLIIRLLHSNAQDRSALSLFHHPSLS